MELFSILPQLGIGVVTLLLLGYFVFINSKKDLRHEQRIDALMEKHREERVKADEDRMIRGKSFMAFMEETREENHKIATRAIDALEKNSGILTQNNSIIKDLLKEMTLLRESRRNNAEVLEKATMEIGKSMERERYFSKLSKSKA